MNEKLDRQAARERCEKAAPGPWGSKCSRRFCSAQYHTDHKIRNDRKKGQPLHDDESVGHEIASVSGGGGYHKGDADFIAHARTDLPLALAELDAQSIIIASHEYEIAKLEAEISKVRTKVRTETEQPGSEGIVS